MRNVLREKCLEMEQEKSQRANKVERRVMDELLTMGFDYGYIGTHHMHDALALAVNTNPENFANINQFLLHVNTRICQKYGVGARCNLTSMRYATEKAFQLGNIDYLLEVFKGAYDPDKGIVDNRTFIMTVRNRIGYEMEEEQALGVDDLKEAIWEAVDKITDISTLASLWGITAALKGGGTI